ncbi:hypothetical protein ABVT39_007618 [Epinephelus coioides]
MFPPPLSVYLFVCVVGGASDSISTSVSNDVITTQYKNQGASLTDGHIQWQSLSQLLSVVYTGVILVCFPAAYFPVVSCAEDLQRPLPHRLTDLIRTNSLQASLYTLLPASHSPSCSQLLSSLSHLPLPTPASLIPPFILPKQCTIIIHPSVSVSAFGSKNTTAFTIFDPNQLKCFKTHISSLQSNTCLPAYLPAAV